MKWSQYIVTVILIGALTAISVTAGTKQSFGGVPGYVWGLVAGLLALAAVAQLVVAGLSTRKRLFEPSGKSEITAESMQRGTKPVVDSDGPPYPHPVINVQTCIGCHACVDACPHDVLTIVNGKAMPVAIEQCTEDTSCQVECPTVPKSCVVVNTTKKIPPRKVPQRDNRFRTNVPGIFLIGDVSGVPLIKNAINVGGAVVDHVIDDLGQGSNGSGADYDLAIIGLGPAGLSAAVMAARRGLKYVAMDQEQVLATIQQTYQAGKYVYFNPVDQAVNGGIAVEGPGSVKESMVDHWLETLRSNNVRINEHESCTSITRREDSFVVATERELARGEDGEYNVRRVVLAIGNRGTPMKLRVVGEELKIKITPSAAVLPHFCRKCGAKRGEAIRFCQQCGEPLVSRVPAPYEDDKVKFKLTDPRQYQGKHVLVIGAGNSAVEAAIDLAATRSDDETKITGWRDNHVSLLVRSDFKGDLKLANKMLVYDCIDAKRISAYFGMTVKEITLTEVVLMSARERDPKTGRETARLSNDYVFALIGGEKPTKFLEGLGIKIG